MAHITDQELIAHSRSSARYVIDHPQVAFVGLTAVLAWGVFGYMRMPQRKDPDIQVRQCMIVTPWPGVEAARVEQLITKKIERQVGLNARIDEIKSISRNGLSVVYAEVQEKGSFDVMKEFDDLKVKLDGIRDLPDGSGPIYFVKDFGDTAALMLTVASPRVGASEIESRAAAIREAITEARRGSGRCPDGSCAGPSGWHGSRISQESRGKPALVLGDIARSGKAYRFCRVPASSRWISLRPAPNRICERNCSTLRRRTYGAIRFILTCGCRSSCAIQTTRHGCWLRWPATSTATGRWTTSRISSSAS